MQQTEVQQAFLGRRDEGDRDVVVYLFGITSLTDHANVGSLGSWFPGS